MFDTGNYLHYVMDTREDHYTGELLRLSPKAYLWNQLRKNHGFSAAVFVEFDQESFSLEAFDSESEHWLRGRKKTWFRPKENEPLAVQHAVLRQAEVGCSDERSLLRMLLEKQKQSKEKTALVISCAAMEKLLECSDAKGERLLRDFVADSPGTHILVVRVERSAGGLQKIAFSSSLKKLDSSISAAVGGKSRRPLQDTLREQLADRLVDYGCLYSEIHNMLLLEELAYGSGEDSMEQLSDQAEYLRLCCEYGVGLNGMPGIKNNEKPLRRTTLRSALHESVFRKSLRSNATNLRQNNAAAAMEELFLNSVGYLPNPDDNKQVCWHDGLTKKAMSLALPDAYKKANPALIMVPSRVQTALETVWNKPWCMQTRNMIDFCLDKLVGILESEDWDTATDALQLLQVSARHLCADADMKQSLVELFELGKEVMQLSSDWYTSMRAIREIEGLSYENPNDLNAKRNEIEIELQKENLSARNAMLAEKRSQLQKRIICFDTEDVDPQQIRRVLEGSREHMKEVLRQNAQLMALRKESKNCTPNEDVPAQTPPVKEESSFVYSREETSPTDAHWKKDMGFTDPWEEKPSADAHWKKDMGFTDPWEEKPSKDARWKKEVGFTDPWEKSAASQVDLDPSYSSGNGTAFDPEEDPEYI